MRFLRIDDDVPPAWIIDPSRDPQPDTRPIAPAPEELDLDPPTREEPVVEHRVIILEI